MFYSVKNNERIGVNLNQILFLERGNLNQLSILPFLPPVCFCYKNVYEGGSMRKLLILLLVLGILKSCIKAVFEPYWEDAKKEKSVSHKRNTESESSEQ